MTMMLRSYLITALRNFLRHKGYSALNIAGLSIGLACSTLIMVFVLYELSYDTFRPKADRIYRVYKQDPGAFFIGSDRFAVVPAPLGKAMEADFPEVESSVKLATSGSGLFRVDGKAFLEDGLMWAEPTFFSIFDFPLVAGDPASALSQPYTVVLSNSVTARLFGTASPLGRLVRLNDRTDLTVTGVFADPPKNSQLVPNILISFATYEITQTRKEYLDWTNSSYYTYVLLREHADVRAVEARLPAFTMKYLGAKFQEWKQEAPTKFFLQPLTDIHLHSAGINMDAAPNGDIRTIYILAALALVILATACINYVNLATARATLRAREVGIRKVVGAGRAQLIRQFLTESMVYAVGAALVAFAVVELALPPFARLVDRDLPASLLGQGKFLLGYWSTVLIAGLLSGGYPALVLTSFKPAVVLKRLARGRARSRMRDALVVAQFAASIALLTCTIVLLEQLHFIRTTDLGFNRDHVLVLKTRGLPPEKKTVFKDRVRQSASVVDAALSMHLPINVSSSTGIQVQSDSGEQHEITSYQLYADPDFLATYQIPLVAGRPVPPGVQGDSNQTFLVNERFAKAAGWKDAVGKPITGRINHGTVVGVLRDFHMHSLHEPIEPLIVRPLEMPSAQYLGLRISPANVPGTIAALRKIWQEFFPDYPFDYTFLDDGFNRMYQNEERLSEIVSLFTALGLVVSSLGLFGLATFVVEQRKREIGVRKVYGASVSSLVGMLSREFLLLVAVANLIAWPLAFWAMRSWLEDFAYRIPLSIGYFLAAGLAAACLALLTVSYQSVRAARGNPVDALRYE